jgi:hypothetical protein
MKIKEYETAEDLVNMVIDHVAPACIIVSEGGLGKTYLVKTLCEEKCPDYKYFSGHMTPKQVYSFLYDNPDKIIVFDDIEDLLKNDKTVGILKGALWSVKNNKKVSYAATERDGSSLLLDFEFIGGIIILLNKIPRDKNPIVRALKSRSLYYEIHLNYRQKLKIMEQILRKDSFYYLIKCELSNEEREKLIKDLRENTSPVIENFNYRTMEKLVMYYSYTKKMYPDQPNRYIDLHNHTIQKNEEKELVYKLKKSGLSIKSQLREFIEKTGKSRATFYRVKKEIANDEKTDKSF